ncbi:nucleoside deaminase [Microbacterium sp. 18062]|uniref:nucleoside deaminase n=1 Tax=Microbacterium sp. 18062 TaxID=2681410 RepID=UPI00190F2B02|nr:nucleoside deaminase [Microbacterium sp. 18062]
MSERLGATRGAADQGHDEPAGDSAPSPDERYLLQAIALAARARRAGDPPFGSLLVDAGGVVLRRARNTVVTSGDITAHPELKLARWAARALSLQTRRGLTLHTSCEPCPMCANAIARAEIGRVSFALSTAQLALLKPPGYINADAAAVVYDGPALHAAAAAPLEGYYR